MVKRLLAFFVLVVVGSSSAWAAFPATVTPGQKTYTLTSSYGTRAGPDLASICQAMVSLYNANGASITYNSVNESQQACYWNNGSYLGTFNASVSDGSPTYSCPSNSLLSGTSCSCKSGFDESNGQCVNNAQEAKCQDAKGGSDMYSGHTARPPVGQTYCPSTGNGANCAAIVEGGFAGKKAGQPLSWTYDIKYTGSTCTPPATSPTPAPTVCKGQPGTVNGVEVCIPFGKNDPVETVKNTTSTNPVAPGAQPGSGGSTSSTQESSCTGSKCTTTTTTTTTDGAGVSTTTTKTDEVPKDDFCKENPRSIACKEFNFGDLETQEVGNKNVQLGIVKEPGFGPTSGTCPAPKVATVLGVSLVMPYTLLCEFAEKIKPLLIGFAYLSAALTFFGFARK